MRITVGIFKCITALKLLGNATLFVQFFSHLGSRFKYGHLLLRYSHLITGFGISSASWRSRASAEGAKSFDLYTPVLDVSIPYFSI